MAVSPCPGKCFSVATTPPACRPSTAARTIAPTRPGSSPNERMLITGLRGLLFTSATGAKFTCTPMAAGLLRGDPRGLAHQPGVTGRAEGHGAREQRVPPLMRMPTPCSKSARDQQRQRRHALQPIEDRGQLQRLAENRRSVGGVQHHRRHRLDAAERAEAAEVDVAHERGQRLELGGRR